MVSGAMFLEGQVGDDDVWRMLAFEAEIKPVPDKRLLASSTVHEYRVSPCQNSSLICPPRAANSAHTTQNLRVLLQEAYQSLNTVVPSCAGSSNFH